MRPAASRAAAACRVMVGNVLSHTSSNFSEHSMARWQSRCIGSTAGMRLPRTGAAETRCPPSAAPHTYAGVCRAHGALMSARLPSIREIGCWASQRGGINPPTRHVVVSIHGWELEHDDTVVLALRARPNNEGVCIAAEEHSSSKLGDHLAVDLVVKSVRGRSRELTHASIVVAGALVELDEVQYVDLALCRGTVKQC